jgi:nucleotide-binding universal stress UspA family protein
VLGGTPAHVLLDLFAEDDLVVMTSRGHGGAQRWLLGSTAEKLVRESVAPVLLVPDAAVQPFI